MIKAPTRDDAARHDRDDARAQAIAEITAPVAREVIEAIGDQPADNLACIAGGAVGLAMSILNQLPDMAMQTWLAYQGEAEGMIAADQHASAAWSSRTAHVAVSQIAEHGKMIATEAWPFIDWLSPSFYDQSKGQTEASLRDWFGDAILLMPAWLQEIQS